MSTSPAEDIIICTVPEGGPLGTEDDEFSNVKFTVVSVATGEPCGKTINVEFFSDGKLGALSGGLLRMEDFRKAKSREDVSQMPLAAVDMQIAELDKPLVYSTKPTRASNL